MSTVDDLSADVLIVGAGPSGSVVAHTLATRGLSVICLEQGDWVNPTEMPGSKPEFELLTRTKWHWEPNVRGRREDYPLELSDAQAPVSMFGAVGGSSIVYGAHWMRLLPSDFRVRTLDGVGRRLADRLRGPRAVLQPGRRVHRRRRTRRRSRVPRAGLPDAAASDRPRWPAHGRGDERPRVALVAGHPGDPVVGLQEHGPVRALGGLRTRLSGRGQGILRPVVLAARHRRGGAVDSPAPASRASPPAATGSPTAPSGSTATASSTGCAPTPSSLAANGVGTPQAAVDVGRPRQLLWPGRQEPDDPPQQRRHRHLRRGARGLERPGRTADLQPRVLRDRRVSRVRPRSEVEPDAAARRAAACSTSTGIGRSKSAGARPPTSCRAAPARA